MPDKSAGLTSLFATVAAGQGERAVVYGLKDIDTGDTVDVGSGAHIDFTKVKDAEVILAGSNAVMKAAPTIAGTVLTFAQSGWLNEYGYLLVVGNSP